MFGHAKFSDRKPHVIFNKMKKGFLADALPNQHFFPPPPLIRGKRNEEHFLKDRLCGEGSFCEVWEVTEVGTGEKFALKMFNKSRLLRNKRENDVLMEKHCMVRLNEPGHKNVVKMFDSFANSSNICILYEYCPSELWKFVNECGGIRVRRVAQDMMYQILEGVEYIHSKNLVHRDLKTENVLVMGNCLKICDFSTSRDLDNPRKIGAGNRVRGRSTKVLEHYVGTANFLPPEAIRNKGGGKETDYWALGGVLYQILTGRPPFQDKSEYLTYCRISDRAYVVHEHFTDEVLDFLDRCFQIESSKRMTVKEMKEHSFFSGYDPDKELVYFCKNGKPVVFEPDMLPIREFHDPFLPGRHFPVPRDKDLTDCTVSSGTESNNENDET